MIKKEFLGGIKQTVRSLALLLLVLWSVSACRTTVSEPITYPVLVEIVGGSEGLDPARLQEIFDRYGVDSSRLYAWENRWLIYEFASRELTAPFREDLGEAFPEAETRIYDVPYYVFDRSGCESGQTETPWERKIWTANLVADPALQQEYMDYHANQFEQFPEVSAGFCRADFQQLLMYRDGRQIVLIINYPAGEDYDTLNARTVWDNPRVDEWNAIMAQYQEGIEGTQPGEVWVSYEPVQ